MKTKWPPHWIYYASNAYISAKTYTFELMKAHLCGLLQMAKLAESSMDVRNTGKVPNQKVAKSQIVLLLLVLDKKFALV